MPGDLLIVSTATTTATATVRMAGRLLRAAVAVSDQ